MSYLYLCNEQKNEILGHHKVVISGNWKFVKQNYTFSTYLFNLLVIKTRLYLEYLKKCTTFINSKLPNWPNPAQISYLCILFHKNSAPQDFISMTLSRTACMLHSVWEWYYHCLEVWVNQIGLSCFFLATQKLSLGPRFPGGMAICNHHQ